MGSAGGGTSGDRVHGREQAPHGRSCQRDGKSESRRPGAGHCAAGTDTAAESVERGGASRRRKGGRGLPGSGKGRGREGKRSAGIGGGAHTLGRNRSGGRASVKQGAGVGGENHASPVARARWERTDTVATVPAPTHAGCGFLRRQQSMRGARGGPGRCSLDRVPRKAVVAYACVYCGCTEHGEDLASDLPQGWEWLRLHLHRTPHSQGPAVCTR
jgi:hypothetical protein